MAKTETAAAVIGVLAGLWDFVGVTGWFPSLKDVGVQPLCAGYGGAAVCTPQGFMLLLLSPVLVIYSLVCSVGLKRVSYSYGILAALVTALVALDSLDGIAAPGVLLALGLTGMTSVLSLVAVKRQSSLPEQANPMNLPVFG
jgi:hypothetical protein